MLEKSGQIQSGIFHTSIWVLSASQALHVKCPDMNQISAGLAIESQNSSEQSVRNRNMHYCHSRKWRSVRHYKYLGCCTFLATQTRFTAFVFESYATAICQGVDFMLYSSELPLHNVITTPLYLAIPQYDPEPTNYSPLNEISDLVNFASNPMASTSNTESFYEQSQAMYDFEAENFAGWGNLHIYQSTGSVDQIPPTDQENVYQPIYAPMHGANFSAPSINMQMYSPAHTEQYSPPSALIPATPSTSSSQVFLSPWHNSGNISSTPTTPLTIPPALGSQQEQAASAPPAHAAAYQEQVVYWKNARSLPVAGGNPDFILQKMYRPHTASDIKRYIEEVILDPPIIFWMEGPDECGIPLSDALHSRTRRLRDHDKEVFEGRGPSVSIRLEWPGYRQWSRQIPTKDFKSPPRPINMTKLCKNIAKCVQRFITERQHCELEDGVSTRWRVGDSPRHRGIRLDDLVLVSLHHVSMGSWQPQLRLRTRLR